MFHVFYLIPNLPRGPLDDSFLRGHRLDNIVLHLLGTSYSVCPRKELGKHTQSWFWRSRPQVGFWGVGEGELRPGFPYHPPLSFYSSWQHLLSVSPQLGFRGMEGWGSPLAPTPPYCCSYTPWPTRCSSKGGPQGSEWLMWFCSGDLSPLCSVCLCTSGDFYRDSSWLQKKSGLWVMAFSFRNAL